MRTLRGGQFVLAMVGLVFSWVFFPPGMIPGFFPEARAYSPASETLLEREGQRVMADGESSRQKPVAGKPSRGSTSTWIRKCPSASCSCAAPASPASWPTAWCRPPAAPAHCATSTRFRNRRRCHRAARVRALLLVRLRQGAQLGGCQALVREGEQPEAHLGGALPGARHRAVVREDHLPQAGHPFQTGALVRSSLGSPGRTSTWWRWPASPWGSSSSRWAWQSSAPSTNGMLVKRPLLVTDATVIPGFKEATWEEALGR